MKQLTLLALLLATAVLASCSVKDPMRLDQMKISDPASPGGSTYVTVWRDMKTKRDFYYHNGVKEYLDDAPGVPRPERTMPPR